MKLILTALLLCTALTAIASPKGEHIHGGYGSYHAGGYCSY